MITWFRDDAYRRFCIYDDGSMVFKFVIDESLGVQLFWAQGFRTNIDYVSNYAKNHLTYSAYELTKMLDEGFHFPKFELVGKFPTVKDAQLVAEQVMRRQIDRYLAKQKQQSKE